MNKKQVQKALVCTLASAMFVGGGAVVAQQIVFDNGIAVSAATLTKGDYIYTELSDGGVRFLGYAPTTYDSKTDKEIVHTPKSATMTIPSSINNKPVREIGVLQNVDDYKDMCKKIVIPNTVKIIKANAFTDWSNVTTIEFSGTFSNDFKIESNAFRDLAITSLTLPEKTVSIGSNAFADCDNLQTLTVKNTSSLTIGANAFMSQYKLKTVTFGSAGVKIGEKAFSDCSNLGTVTFGNSTSVVTIGKDAFRDSNISKVVFSKGTTSIGDGAFADCVNLKSANINNLTSLKAISENAFYNTKISSIEIPANVLTIGANAFADIESEADDYGDSSPISIKFNTPSNVKIKIDKTAFDGTRLTSVTVPKLAYNTIEGTISALTFEYANKLTVTNATQRVTDLDDTSIKNVVAPYGSYIWAGVYKASVEDNSSNALPFVTLKGNNIESVYNYNSSEKNIGFSAVKVTEGSNFTVSYDKTITLTDKGAKNVVLTAKLGYANITLKNTSQYNRFFVFTDKMTDAYNGSFKLTNKVDSNGKLTSFLQLSSDITKKYTAQAEKFSDGVLSFDYAKDASSGIYNSTYKTYVSKSDNVAIKPTVIIKLNGKVVPSKYYTLKYADNVGITGKASVTATLNSEGSKIYSSGSIKMSFPVKRNISQVAIYATDTIANSKTEKATNRLYDDAYKSAFLPVTDTNYKIGEGNYRVNLTINGANKSVTKGSDTFSVVYDSSCFAEYNGIDISGVALGEVTCTLKAPSSSIYFFGQCDVRYFTRCNISKLNSVTLINGEDTCTVKSTKDTANKSMLYAKEFTYKAADYKPLLEISQGGSQSEPVEQNYLNYSYVNNKNVSVDGSMAKLASVKATVKMNDCTYLYGSKTVYFKITKKKITDGMFNYTKVFDYTAGAITPTVKGKFNGVDLVQGNATSNKDFLVKYSDNVLAGTGKITVTGYGNYYGSVDLKFVINKISLTNPKCKVTYYYSSNNTVSYRFGLEIRPNISLWYNGKAFSASDDYTVTYIGEKVNGKYTGIAPWLSGKTGYLVITPKSSSKKLYSVGNDAALKTYEYKDGETVKKVTGVLFSYQTDALTLDHLHLVFNPTIEATDLNTFRKSIAPRILINGQVLAPYNPAALRNELTAAILKSNPSKTANECRSLANSRIPLTAKNRKNKSAEVRAYYGYYTNNKTNFKIVGILVNNTDNPSVSGNYWDIKDDFYIQNTREKSGRWLIGTFCYATEAGETTNSYKGLKLQSKITTVNGRTTTSWIVKPGLHHIYTMNAYITGYTAGIDKSKTWDFNVSPSKSSITMTDYKIEKVPGTASVSFAPSVSDKYDGKTYYTLKFYKTIEDAKNDKNVATSVVLKYSKNSASITTAGLALISSANGVDKYSYTMKGLDYGRSYFVTVTATDSENEISSTRSAATAFMTSTTIGTIDTISYTQSGANFNAVAKITQPSHKLNESGNIAHIYYIMKIYTNGGTLLKTYYIDEHDTSGYKQISKADHKTVDLGAVPGMKASEEYYATLETYLAYNTGVFTNTTYPVKCTYCKVANSNTIYPMSSKTYKLTNTDKFSSSVSVDKTRVNAGQPIKITAATGQTGTKKGAAPYIYKYEILNSSGSLVGTAVTHSNVSALSDTYIYTPTSTGTFNVRVTIKDKNNITSISVQNFTVLTALSNTSSLSASEVPINKGLTVNLSKSGGDTSSFVKYTVKLTKPDGTTSTLLSDSTQSSYIIDYSKNSIEGKYKVTVIVTDATGNAVAKTLEYTVSNSFVNTSKISTTSPYVNAPFTITLSSAGVSSNVSYTVSYAKYDTSKKSYGSFTICNDVDGNKLSAVSLAAGVSKNKNIRISSTGKYKVRITAKNGNSTKIVDTIVNVSYADLVNESIVQSEVITVADTLKLKAMSFGGVGNVKYRAMYANINDINNMQEITLDSNGNGTLVGAGVKNGTLKAGNYIIKVTATDSKNTVVNKDIYVSVKSLSSFYTSAPTLSVGNTTLKTDDGIVLGSKLSLKGSPAADVTVIYEYKQVNNSSYKKMTVGDNGVATMTPQSATDYNLRVTYISGDGLTVSRTWTIHVVNGTTLRKSVTLYNGSTKLGTNPEIALNEKIKIVTDKISNCTVSYDFKNTKSSTWYTMNTASDGKTATGKPNAAGKYEIRIKYTLNSKVYYEYVTFNVKI